METKAWKKEKEFLSEAYRSVYAEGTDGKTDDLTEFEKKRLKGAVEKPEDEEEEDNNTKTEEVSLPMDDIGEPVEPIDGIEPDAMLEPDEVDAEVEALKQLILNPPADKVEEYARSGRLHDYIDMLQKKLQAAEAMKSVYRGEED